MQHGTGPVLDDDLTLFGTNSSSNTNRTLDDDDDPEFQARIEHLQWVAYGIVAPVLIVFGLVGNVLNLIVLTRPNLKGVMYTYLLWLAISDMMSLVFTIPTLLRFVGVSLSDYYSAWYHAHIELALVNAFMACSVFIVVAVTVDRFFSVSRPTKYKKVHTPDRARLWIGCSYAGAFLLYVPVCFFREVHRVDDDSDTYVVQENFHVTRNAAWTVYLWFKETLVRLGPSVILTILNVLIIIAFQRVVRRRKALLHNSRFSYSAGSSPGRGGPRAVGGDSSSAGGQQSSSYQEEGRLVMLLIFIVFIFIVTMTPAAFLVLFSSYEKEKSFGFQVFRAFANNMEFVNYAMNFYLYCLCSSEIRSTFLRLINLIKSQPRLNRNPAHGHHHHGLPPPPSVLDEQATTTATVVVDSKI